MVDRIVYLDFIVGGEMQHVGHVVTIRQELLHGAGSECGTIEELTVRHRRLHGQKDGRNPLRRRSNQYYMQMSGVSLLVSYIQP